MRAQCIDPPISQVIPYLLTNKFQPLITILSNRDFLLFKSFQNCSKRIEALTSTFSNTNNTDSKHIKPSASSRKPLCVRSSFSGITIFSHTCMSVFPIFVPKQPIIMSGVPVTSTVCHSSQCKNLGTKLSNHILQWAEPRPLPQCLWCPQSPLCICQKCRCIHGHFQ